MRVRVDEFNSYPGLKEKQTINFGVMTGVVQNDRLNFDKSYSEVMSIVNEIGHTPLPSYITPGEGVAEPKLRQIYQGMKC